MGSRAAAVVFVCDRFQKFTHELLLANTHQQNSLKDGSTREAGLGLWRPPEPGSSSRQSQLAGHIPFPSQIGYEERKERWAALLKCPRSLPTVHHPGLGRSWCGVRQQGLLRISQPRAWAAVTHLETFAGSPSSASTRPSSLLHVEPPAACAMSLLWGTGGTQLTATDPGGKNPHVFLLILEGG